jgi:phosphate:Na+ symporter
MQALTGKLVKELFAKTEFNKATSFGVGLVSGVSVLSVSSSTNMIIGLVNSGIVKFRHAALLIMGINIGATFFPWLLTFDLGNWSYLFIFIGALGHYFIRVLVIRLISRVILSIGFLYLGMNLCVNYFSSDHLLNIELLKNTGLLFLFGAFFSGAIVSYLLNSTAILIGVFMAFFYTHNISVEISCAILIGANLGPSLRLYFNSKKGNIIGSRAALFNIILNASPVVLYLALLSHFGSYLSFFENLFGTLFVLPIFYTLINILNSVFAFSMFGFIKSRIYSMIKTPDVKIPQKLISFGGSKSMVPATSLWQANSELKKLGSILDRMFLRTTDYINAVSGSPKALAKIKKYEDVTDRINSEMKDFVEDLIEHTLNEEQSIECLSLVSASKEYENIADYINKLVTYKTRLSLDGELDEKRLLIVNNLFIEAHEIFKLSCQSLNGIKKMDQQEMLKLSLKFKDKCEKIRFEHSNGNLVFSDLIMCIRKIRSHSYRLFLEL